MGETVGIGLVGVGGTFAAMIIDALRDVPRGRLVAIADVNQRALDHATKTLGVDRAYIDAAKLIEDERVHAVIVATPPFTQFGIASQILERGKALFLEKPGSVRIADLQRLVELQRGRHIPATIDYVMRWNQLLDVVRTIRSEGFLGELRSVQYMNYAQDETLPAGHWFWDRSKSGGIWVEHAVHFFDLYGQLVGAAPASVSAAMTVRDDRAPGGRVDQVQGTVCHENGVLCGYFHAFNRPKAMERQEAILAFDHGFITVHGWIADAVDVEGWVDRAAADALGSLPHAVSQSRQSLSAEMQRGDTSWRADEHVRHRFQLPWDRNESYRREVAAGLNDLLDSMEDPAHRQRVTLTDALRSLAVACAVSGTATVDEARGIYESYVPDGR